VLSLLRKTGGWIPFLLGWSICLVSVWSHEYWGSVDGPSHVYNAFALGHYFDPACPVYREFYLVNPFPVPNLAATLSLTLLMVVAPPLVAEKLFLSACILLLPLALRYALGAIDPRSRVVACLVFPFVMGLPLMAGWYSFAAGTVAVFLTLGYWLRQPHPLPRPARRRLFWLFALLYLCHPFPLAVTLLVIGCVAAWQARLEFRAGPRAAGLPGARRLATLAWRRGWPALKQAVPVVALLGLFWVLSNLLADPWPDAETRSLLEIGKMLLINESMAPLSDTELLLAPFFACFLLMMFVLTLASRTAREASHPWYGLLLALVVLVVMMLALPERAMGGGNLARRLAVYINLMHLLWLGAQRYGRAARAAIVLVALAVTGAQSWVRMPLLGRIDAYHRALRQAAAPIEGNSVVLPLNLDWTVVRQPDLPAILVRNSAAYLVADRCFVDIGNYEGHLLYSPLSFNPDVHAMSLVTPDSLRDRLEHARIPDWVLVWGAPDRLAPEKQRDAQAFHDILAGHYEPVSRTGDEGASAWLYRARVLPSSPR